MTDERPPASLPKLLYDLRDGAVLTREEKQRRTPRQTGRLTQEEAASRVGVERGVWNKWEKGRRGISEENARRIADAFDRPADDVLGFVRGRGLDAQLIEIEARIETRLSERLDAQVRELRADVVRLLDQREARARQRGRQRSA